MILDWIEISQCLRSWKRRELEMHEVCVAIRLPERPGSILSTVLLGISYPVFERTQGIPDGDVTLEPPTDDLRLELLGYVTLLMQLESGPATDIASYESIPCLRHPRYVWDSMATIDPAIAVQRAHADVVETIETDLANSADAIEAEATDTAAEAGTRLNTPQQVNLPVDNHMTFVESGLVPDVETEPVPAAVPETNTLHIVHGEHNTVTVWIRPGVYRFSLLPRGLQPADTRLQWPEN